MCGIAALLGLGRAIDARPITPMTRVVAHRGPDGEGTVALGGEGLAEVSSDDAHARVALGHRRLSILDLSDAGRQPMRRGDLWITYNGEVFNFVEVRSELAQLGERFTTGTDTEVLLAAWARWGPSCLDKLRGMWGFVIVDVRAQRAWVCRDRLGIKPVYVAEHGGALAVASEIKQIAKLKSLPPDDHAVAAYLQSGFEDPRRTMRAGVRPVAAGTYLEVDLARGLVSEGTPYWFPERVRAHVSDPDEAAARFDDVFRASVRIHLRSDVPVGCALSGGLDSSSIAAVVSEEGRTSGAQLESFSARFPGFALDEGRYVDAVVAHTGAVPHSVEPSVAGLLADLDRFLWCHDEPPGSLSQYAAYTVARLTRQARVPVTLNGQGGDEILGGYWQTAFARLFRERSDPARLARWLAPALLPGGNREVFAQAPAMARRYLARRRPHAHVPLRDPALAEGASSLRALEMTDAEQRVFEIRELTLPRLLKWDDRNFMAFGVEGRYPFLDHHVIETCLSFDARALFVAGWTKEPLRRALEGHLPDAVVRRRGKVGFETPQDAWLKGAVGDELERSLARGSPLARYLDVAQTRRVVAHARRARDRERSQAAVRMALVDRWLRGLGVPA